MADSSDATQTAQQELDAPQQQATGALTLQRSPETAIAIPAERLLGCQLKLTMHKRLALAPPVAQHGATFSSSRPLIHRIWKTCSPDYASPSISCCQT